MSYEILERKIKNVPNEYIEDVVNYIDYICYKYEQSKEKESETEKKLEALQSVFGCIDNEQAEILRSCTGLHFKEV